MAVDQSALLEVLDALAFLRHTGTTPGAYRRATRPTQAGTGSVATGR